MEKMSAEKVQKGVSIIQMIGVMAILTLIGSMAYLGVAKSREQGMNEKFFAFADSLEKNAKDYADFYREEAAIDNAALLKAKVLPETACQGMPACPTPKHPLGGAVVVEKAGGEIKVMYSLVPKKACINLISRPSKIRKDIRVNGTLIPTLDGVSVLAKSCGGKNTVTVTLDTGK